MQTTVQRRFKEKLGETLTAATQGCTDFIYVVVFSKHLLTERRTQKLRLLNVRERETNWWTRVPEEAERQIDMQGLVLSENNNSFSGPCGMVLFEWM